MIPASTASYRPADFSDGWRSLAHSRWVPFALLTLGTASNAIYAHTPLVAFASIRPGFSQLSWAGHVLWVAIALIGGFVLYQGPIVLAYPVMADGHFMGWEIIAKLFVKQVLWTGAIALGHSITVQ